MNRANIINEKHKKNRSKTYKNSYTVINLNLVPSGFPSIWSILMLLEVDQGLSARPVQQLPASPARGCWMCVDFTFETWTMALWTRQFWRLNRFLLWLLWLQCGLEWKSPGWPSGTYSAVFPTVAKLNDREFAVHTANTVCLNLRVSISEDCWKRAFQMSILIPSPPMFSQVTVRQYSSTSVQLPAPQVDDGWCFGIWL